MTSETEHLTNAVAALDDKTAAPIDASDLDFFASKAEEEAGEVDDEFTIHTAGVIPEPTSFLPKRVRHLKSGGTYRVLGIGRMQAEGWKSANPCGAYVTPVDMQEVVLYRSEADGSYWARPRAEFMDGRFEVLRPDRTPCPTPHELGIFYHDGVWYLPIDPKLAEAINRPEVDLTEEQFFMIEAAEQIAGIETIDDDARTYVVTREQIVKLMTTVRDTTREHTREYLTSVDLGEFIKVAVENASDIDSEVTAAEAVQIAHEAAALAVRERIEPFKVNEFIDDEVATLIARFDGNLQRSFLEREIGELAREAVLRVIFDKATMITNLANEVHAANVAKGWWTDLKTGQDLHGTRNIGELLALMHSEISEALEAHDGRYFAMRADLAKVIQIASLAMVKESVERDRLLDIHSSLSRALEAWRKDKRDDKLPHRPGFRVELIDAMIRILDTLGSEQNGPDEHPAGIIFCEKTGYNAVRPDHMIENRLKDGGKKI